MSWRSGPSKVRGRGRWHESPGSRSDVQTSLALGFLAMLPLFLFYELAARHVGARNTAEVLLGLPLAPFGERADFVRRIALAAGAIVALWHTFAAALGLVPRLVRIVFEGALAAALFGPLLVLLLNLLGAEPPPLQHASAAPDLPLAGLVCGGAAFEEVVFRVGVQSLVYLLAHRLLSALGASDRAARVTSELVAIALAGIVFAAAHLEVLTRDLGAGGEEFDPRVFTWRALAGMLLSALFRWRGPGVAAWAHALFNLALLIGAGPDVFL